MKKEKEYDFSKGERGKFYRENLRLNLPLDQLLEKFASGDRRALARLISLVENNSNDSTEILDKLHPRTGQAYRIGITGPPGAGKSTLVDELTKLYRQQGQTVGIIAVDPTSPFTGGALLGDRVRMSDLSGDDGVFIRSMATRGSLGGLSHRAQEVADVLDAFGKDIVMLETVGVGQSELDIVEAVDTTIVVLVPESGDSVQAMKAGLMEIADIFVLSKADRGGADRAMLEIQAVLSLSELSLSEAKEPERWNPPVIKTIAREGRGVADLLQAIIHHGEFLKKQGLFHQKRRQRLEKQVKKIIDQKLRERFWTLDRERLLKAQLDEVSSPQKIVKKLFSDY
ncbi:MAG: methylmalonyl Co-A mutase-associated GTPase MeaB [candidate division KSB1 bacterium]|nr:methylmalonyl Co-A mutase-associated GTPase MeaB [candidate division KSB1 bacterium]